MASTPSWRSKQRLAEVSAEFLGTGLFLFVTVSSVVNWGGPILEPIGIAAAFGGSITVLAAAFGDISGGHFNCAVTIGLMANRSIDAVKAVQYIWAQVTGAVVGASLARACARDYASSLKAVNLVSHGYSDGQVFGAECIATALLVVTVILTTNAQRRLLQKRWLRLRLEGRSSCPTSSWCQQMAVPSIRPGAWGLLSLLGAEPRLARGEICGSFASHQPWQG
jgi:glycerol uptake facilitator-like aquaporin